jgi:cobalt-zinc-cadmium efflux system protein
MGIGLNVVYVAIEVAVGVWGNSLALLSDAGHNLSDVIGLLLAWGGHALAQIPPTRERTYGWRSTTILAALFNALLLLVAVGGIVGEALRRLFTESAIPSAGMIGVAAVGVLINTATALLFLRGRDHDLNIRGAFLHMAADAAVSLGVVLAGIAIQITRRTWIDPVTSLVIAAIIFIGTWDLLRQSLHLAMQAVPPGIDPQAVRELLASAAGVTQVRDLHIWAMSTTENALTAHLVKPGAEDDDRLLRELERQLHERFGIEHVTIQIERAENGAACSLVGR